MKIGLDLRMLGGGSGIDRYITELSHEILSAEGGSQPKADQPLAGAKPSGGKPPNQYVLFFRDADKSANYKQYNQKIVIADIPHYSFAEQFKLPKILKQENLDLVHFPHFNVPIFYRRPFLVTIHDLTHTKFPGRKKSHFFHRLAYNLVMRASIRNSTKIIAVSEATKREILEYFRVPAEKVAVIYEGVNKNYKPIDKEVARNEVRRVFNLHQPFLLYVGVWRRYKNLPTLAAVFDRLAEKFADLELVLAGEPDPFYPEIKAQVMNIKNRNKLHLVGRISDAHLNLLYNAAKLFVLPSKAEGFGLTALEAATCGTPMACSDIPTLREVLGQAAEYFDPQNQDNMYEVIVDLLQNSKRLEELVDAGLKRAKVFSWQKAAEETIKVYEAENKIPTSVGMEGGVA